ncbi:P22 superfamily phage coat protein [Candidatus Megaera polyxenophila]|nr:P22 superfamily phage coat protein [Candidatus Megaera polyxenophila]
MATFDRSNFYQTELFEKNVLIPYLQDYRNVTNFARFMGGSDAVIYNKMENKGDGDRIVFPLRQTFDPIVSIGNDQLEGNEQELTYVSDMVDVGRIRFATLLTDAQLTSIQTKFNLESDVRADLLSQADMLNTKRILQAFALAFDGGAAGVVPSLNQQFTYGQLRDRILASRLDQAAGGISRARILIGDPNLVGGNARTTYADLATALLVANFPVATNTMNVSHIRQLFNQAATGQSLTITNAAYTVKESSIRPYKYKTYAGFEDKRYVLFVAPETYNRLASDPVWQAQVNRGVIENKDQPSILYGSMYKGTIEGVMIIVIPELSNFLITNGAGNIYALSLFCGASALGFGMGQTPTFTFRSSTDYELYHGMAHNEISGIKALKYPSKARGVRGNNNNLVEYGYQYSFTTIA